MLICTIYIPACDSTYFCKEQANQEPLSYCNNSTNTSIYRYIIYTVYHLSKTTVQGAYMQNLKFDATVFSYSHIYRPSNCPVVNCLQYAKTGQWEGLGLHEAS